MSKPKEVQISGKNYFAWEYEEQTKVKHKVLGSYAKIWISKLGYKSNTLFFDCHGGCGAYIDDKSDISYGSSILVKQIADDLSKKRSTKTGVYYCEKDKNTYDNFIKIKNDLGNIKINTYNDSFENVISKSDVSKYYNNYPTLFLADPFGYNFDINELSVMMKGFGNEVIVNFMFDFITRFISKSELKDSFNRFFGTNEWEKAIDLTGRERETFLVNIFKNKLKEVTGAKFVFSYRLCYPDKDQTYYYLIHATNHIDGITLMKEAFASVNNGRVQYLGKHNNDISLLDLDCFKADEIYNSYFKNQPGKRLTVDEFWISIVEETAYTRKDLNGVLNELVDNKKIKIDRVSSKRGSYKEKDVITVL